MEHKWKVGTEFEVQGKTFRVATVPAGINTGLATLIETSHLMKSSFVIPWTIVDVLYEHHVKFQPPACHDCPIGRIHDQPNGPTCHNYDACQLECERDMAEMREDQNG